MTMSNREPGTECDRHAAMVDDTLAAPRRQAVDAHLDGCESCRNLLADLRQIRSLAATLNPIEPPARVWHDVRRRVAAGGKPPRAAVWWWPQWSLGSGVALAAAAAIVLAVVFIGTPYRVQSPPAGPALPAVDDGLRPGELHPGMPASPSSRSPAHCRRGGRRDTHRGGRRQRAAGFAGEAGRCGGGVRESAAHGREQRR